MNSKYRGNVSLSEVAKVISADGRVSSAGAVSLDIHRELPSYQLFIPAPAGELNRSAAILWK